ncbi:hypothetical protein BH11MYX1_BH11MYX1_10950 [soil metagenome]
MFHFQTLDVYKVAFLPLGYTLAALGDGELASQPRGAVDQSDRDEFAYAYAYARLRLRQINPTELWG